MKRGILGAMVLALLGLCTLSEATQPPGGDKDKGPKGGKKGKGFELGKVLPPFVRDALELTAQQQEQLDALEKDVRKKLEKILTAEQRRQIEQMKGPPKKDGFDKGPPKDDGDNPPKKKDKGPKNNDKGNAVQASAVVRRGVSEYERFDKSFKNHVFSGQRQGVFWETVIPVTDPMERNARERGKRQAAPEKE